MISLVFAAVLAAAAADPAAAGAKEDAAKEAKPAKDEMVCKREAVLGSRMKQRVCMTAEQWDQRKQEAQDDLSAAQRNRPLNSN